MDRRYRIVVGSDGRTKAEHSNMGVIGMHSTTSNAIHRLRFCAFIVKGDERICGSLSTAGILLLQLRVLSGTLGRLNPVQSQ
jgi:hypothetical protein